MSKKNKKDKKDKKKRSKLPAVPQYDSLEDEYREYLRLKEKFEKDTFPPRPDLPYHPMPFPRDPFIVGRMEDRCPSAPEGRCVRRSAAPWLGEVNKCDGCPYVMKVMGCCF